MIDGNAQINSLYDYLTIFFINDKDDIEDGSKPLEFLGNLEPMVILKNFSP